MSATPGYNPALAPAMAQYEIYTQNGPMKLGDGIYITEDGTIEVDAGAIPGTINCGTF